MSTIHTAKGLKFDHVLVVEGLRKTRRAGHDSAEEEGQLYYVAMTRARHTLALIDSLNNPNPYFAEIRNSTLNRKAAVARGESAQPVNLGYRVLGMTDLFIDSAGQKKERHRIHSSLARLQEGDKVDLECGYNGRGMGVGRAACSGSAPF